MKDVNLARLSNPTAGLLPRRGTSCHSHQPGGRAPSDHPQSHWEPCWLDTSVLVKLVAKRGLDGAAPSCNQQPPCQFPHTPICFLISFLLFCELSVQTQSSFSWIHFQPNSVSILEYSGFQSNHSKVNKLRRNCCFHYFNIYLYIWS